MADKKPTPTQVLMQIRADNGAYVVSETLTEILHRKFKASQRYQRSRGVTFSLSFDEFLSMWDKRVLRNMDNRLTKNTLSRFMKSDFGYCLTWNDRAAYLSRVMDASTCCILNRIKSKRAQQFKKGDKHSEKSKADIAAARTGTKHTEQARSQMSASHIGLTHSDETKAKMSAAKTGRKQSPEHRAAIAAGQKARHAAKAAARALEAVV